ncbi:beta-ketoacyl synthase N-terminal-like domain-containing protein [Leptobacterium sp. I13]|uniref:beta-ketoacyl synthase N-terminal-like domain-containing protein n=1 Tax=Leptobacterium meishanense TaxID=3128904 RepID=UPI0030EC08B3
MKNPISITAVASLSPLGSRLEKIWEAYQSPKHYIIEKEFSAFTALVSELNEQDKTAIAGLRDSEAKYKALDNTVLYAIYASRKAVKQASWGKGTHFGINIGSSRGATSLFEKYHKDFLSRKKTKTLSSPTTTLGNISSWAAHDLQSTGPEISHSITCSTALHAMLNGIAWLNAGMADKFLVGGSEAPLTPFTIAQMQALKIYAKLDKEKLSSRAQSRDQLYPCRAFDLEKKKNTMILGEGAAVACLESGIKENALALVEGIGYATEILEHNISISAKADCFQKSMKMALGDVAPDQVDVIVMHAPGTIKGDISEYNAIKKVFQHEVPALTTNKWKIGHTFGASGMLSIELAILMMQYQQFIGVPFNPAVEPPKQIKKVLINAVGFGGNAVSVLLKTPD